MRKTLIVILAAAFALAACKDETPANPVAGPGAFDDHAPETAAPAGGDSAPMGSEYAPMERAKAVEGDVMEGQEAQDAAIEAQGG